MTVTLRTILQWLQEHNLTDNAEVWVLGSNTVEPVTAALPTGGENFGIYTREVWAEPTPSPMQFRHFFDTLSESYSGGGTLEWQTDPSATYRGSYTVNPQQAVFLVFLADSTRLVESHSENLESKKQQAIQLTKEMEQWPDI